MNTRYHLKLENGQVLAFEVLNKKGIDPAELNSYSGIPEWVNLECEQCSVCPFTTKDTTYCPAAFELQDVISQCQKIVSYERVEFSKETKTGTTTTQADMQTALFSVIGEKAISSACTVLNSRQWSLDYYSIMTTPENMFFRSLSTYLVRQFLIGSRDGEPDFQLKGHIEYVEEIISVFGNLLERFRYISGEDSTNNAIVRLVHSGQLLLLERDEWIEELKSKMDR
jgi:hypothetical protein